MPHILGRGLKAEHSKMDTTDQNTACHIPDDSNMQLLL